MDHGHDNGNHHGHRHPHGMTRREMLAGLGAAGLTATMTSPALGDLVAPAPQAAVAGSTQPLFKIERVTNSVYAAISRPVPLLNCNAAIVVTSDHVLVVDSHSKPSAARALIAQIKAEITDKPVRYVINSHFHWDHSQGNLAYPTVFGGSTDIVSSSATREWLKREGVVALKRTLDGLPRQIAELRQREKAIASPAERDQVRARIADLEVFQKEMSPPEKQIALPNITFEERLVIHNGGQEIHLMFLGRGHTAGDVVVYLPAEKVVATGDLMHSILPYMADSYPDEWSRTLTEVEKIDFNRVVPGHGSVQEGKAILAAFRSYIEEVNELVARGVQRGATVEELQKSHGPDKLKSLNATHAARIQQELTKSFGAPPNTPLNTTVAGNISDVYNYYTKRNGKS